MAPDLHWLAWLFAALVGLLLGAFFFGGLWWTVQKSTQVKHPALWVMASFFLRTVVALLGFYAVGQGQWQRLLACLLGFMVARQWVLRRSRAYAPVGDVVTKKASHAP